jgi:hypothetical protein
MILIPIVFVHYLYRYHKFQAAVEVFTREFMFTKDRALNAAFDIAGGAQTRAEALNHLEKETGASAQFKAISNKQIREINLLIDHYLRLLGAEGDSYESLVRNAYQTKTSYKHFLNLLKKAEQEVNKAVMLAFGEKADVSEIVSRMESISETLRIEEVRAIFREPTSLDS